MNIFIAISLALLVLSLIMLSITGFSEGNKIYCYIFEHKAWKLWETVCRRLPLAKFDGYYIGKDKPYLENYEFYIHDIGINEPVIVIYWVCNDSVSVHTDKECILPSFDRYHSNKAKNIIKSMI